MKKILCIILALSTLASILVFGAVATNGAETGKVDPAYTPEGTPITSAAEFAAMTADGKYYLANDITIDATWNGGAELNGTASSNTAFTGTFDGNGKTVTTTVPLFGLISGTVKNLTVAGDITSSASGDGDGVYYSAALAYYAKGDIVIENVVNTANVSGANVSAGFIAVVNTYSTGTLNVKDCVNNGNISTANSNTTDATKGTNKLGGFVAYITGGKGTFENCVNNKELTSTGGGAYNYVGGIVGQIGRTTSTLPVAATCNFTVKNCVNNAKITSEALHCAGIVAFLYGHLEILDCTNNGEIKNTKATGSRAAGIFGTTGGTDYKASILIDGCVNNGIIKGSYHAAGIAAHLGDGIAENGETGLSYWIKNSANYGDIYLDGENHSTSYKRSGGIAAYAAGGTYNGIENCVNMGNVYVNLGYTTKNNPHSGAFVGYVNNAKFTLKNNLNAGQLIFLNLETTTIKPTASMIAYNNQASLTENTANNYSIPGPEGVNIFRLKDGAPLTDETKAKAVTVEQVASGEAVWTLNDAAGKTVFYQDLKTGKITLTAAEDGSNVVIKNGDGTFSNPAPITGPQAIKNAEDFANMLPSGEYYLDADITLSASYANAFTGTFDGKNHTITTVSPLFENLAGTVKNVTVNANIADSGDAHNAIVAVQGSGDITFENVHTTGTVAGGNKVAALLAYGEGGTNVTLKNCVNDASLTGKGHVAGFVACIDGVTNFLAENCVNNGALTSTGAYAAGIATILGKDALTAAQAKTMTVTVKNCTNTGNIKGYNKNCAGIVGYSLGVITIENCVNRGNVENETENAAGILGSSAYQEFKAATYISGCENYGELKAAQKVGGIAAYFARTTPITDMTHSIENCANYGDIYLAASGTQADGCQAAGIAARSYAKQVCNSYVIKNCINLGDITVDMTNGPSTTNAAGIIAYSNQSKHIFENNINLGNITVNNGETNYEVSTIVLRATTPDLSYVKNNYGIAIAGAELAGVSASGFTFTDAMVKEVGAAQVASGELVYTLNTAAGKTVFYQNLKTGEITLTAAEDGSNVVIKNENGTYSNPGSEPEVTTPEETTPVVTPEETTPVVTPEETTPVVTPEETTPVVTPEETTPEATTSPADPTPPTNDRGLTLLAIACTISVIACAVAVIVIKKKEN